MEDSSPPRQIFFFLLEEDSLHEVIDLMCMLEAPTVPSVLRFLWVIIL